MRHDLCLLIYYMMLSITHYGPEICMEKQLRGQLDKKKRNINLKLKKRLYHLQFCTFQCRYQGQI